MTTTIELIIVVCLALVPPLPLWIITWSAWTGRYRRWAIGIGTDVCSFQGRNFLPFPLGVLGTAWAVTVLYGYFAMIVPGDQSLRLILTVVWIGTLATFLWWPQFITPAWYKEWLKRSGGDNLDPSYLWPPDEWREIQKRERAKRQARAERKLEKRRAKSGK